MSNSGRVVGIGLIVAGLVVGLLLAAWLISGVADDESDLRLSGAVLGGVIGFVVLVFPLVGGGALILARSRRESATLDRVSRQRKMLGIVESAGEISINDLALELDTTADDVRSDLYDLVSKGLFSGYVDWERGRLFARQASELRGRTTCPNCGGTISLAGKGLVRCDYCNAEIFLS